MSAPRYRASGSVRGDCKHAHRTISGALDCVMRDRKRCAALGGGSYSDRSVMRIHPVAADASEPLSEPEARELELAEEVLSGAQAGGEKP